MAGIRMTTKWDGILIMTDDWRVFRPRSHMNLIHPLKIQAVKNSTYKGLPLVDKNRSCYKLDMGYIHGMRISFCISLVATERLEYKSILETFKQCMSDAVNAMPRSNTHIDWINQLNLNRKIVFMDDITEFGNRLMNLMTTEIEAMFVTDQHVALKIVIMELGQSTNIKNITRFLDEFRLGYIETLVFHVAMDFDCANHLLGWSYDKTKSALGPPTSEYYAGCLKGVGNFVFNATDEEQDFETECSIVRIQCYSSLFKTAHRGLQLMFGSINIADELFSPAEFTQYFCRKKVVHWEKYKSWIDTVHHLLENIEQNYQLGQSARSEFVVSVSSPIDPDMPLDIVKELKHHKKYSFKNLEHCLVKVKLDDLMQHFQATLKPPLNTLSNMINGRMLALKQGTFTEFSPGMFLNLSI